MDWIVPDFAERFAAGGLAALVFDYRYLGVSGGEPRQLIDTRRQRVDLRHAVEFARSRPDVDATRIALWGNSLGGSHVIHAAAEDTEIAAIVANVPGLDLFRGFKGRYVPSHIRIRKRSILLATFRLLAAAVLDSIRGAIGVSPYYIAVYGRLGRAVFSDPALVACSRTCNENS